MPRRRQCWRRERQTWLGEAEGGEQRGQFCDLRLSGRAEAGRRSQALAGDRRVTVPCFSLMGGGSGREGERVLNSPEQFTDWTESSS